MGIGVSIILLAIGAVLAFATDVTASGIDLDAVGIILMIAGAAGLLFTLILLGTRDRGDEVVERRVYRDGPA
jgi:hypothetical protein